jgi:hypothetical protein
MEVLVGDVVLLRKPHPCGGFEWKVIRIGTDIGITCTTCGRYILLPRGIFERRVKSFVSRGINSNITSQEPPKGNILKQ